VKSIQGSPGVPAELFGQAGETPAL
jgi:hypothetical protein